MNLSNEWQTWVKAFETLPYTLKIIGFSNDGYEDKLKEILGQNSNKVGYYGKYGNIEFLGRMNFEQITPFLKSCLCTVVPSEWYDNFPNSLIESYAFKKAVIATDFGSLKYMVKDGETGFKFRYEDLDDLRSKIAYIFEHVKEAAQMGENGYHLVETIYSPEVHYNQLMQVFSKVMK